MFWLVPVFKFAGNLLAAIAPAIPPHDPDRRARREVRAAMARWWGLRTRLEMIESESPIGRGRDRRREGRRWHIKGLLRAQGEYLERLGEDPKVEEAAFMDSKRDRKPTLPVIE